jgi:hypothetical protein
MEFTAKEPMTCLANKLSNKFIFFVDMKIAVRVIIKEKLKFHENSPNIEPER